MSHHKIEFNHVSYTYPDGYRAVQDISFKIQHGESVGIVGANGAGKSTLLKLLTGILLPDSGEIHVGNMLLTKKNLSHIRQNIGLTFQDSDHQLFMGTVYDDVAFGPRNYNIDEKKIEQKVVEALETVGALYLKDRPSYKLSGGEKRAVAIASVIVMNPSILVMDEPSIALDPRSRRRLINLLSDFTHTKLIVTHDLDMILDLCKRVIVVNQGKIIQDGLTGNILRNEKFLLENQLELPLTLQGMNMQNRYLIYK